MCSFCFHHSGTSEAAFPYIRELLSIKNTHISHNTLSALLEKNPSFFSSATLSPVLFSADLHCTSQRKRTPIAVLLRDSPSRIKSEGPRRQVCDSRHLSFPTPPSPIAVLRQSSFVRFQKPSTEREDNLDNWLRYKPKREEDKLRIFFSCRWTKFREKE
ncbi:unnamed protein product [Cuscuta campestris]|uniref:Uncharacterized protein n=1 Tax=Cuscuta campestris TaxID=132261 RepID=A0A484L8N5_9ASTE|nr:unnamed protein product [Cuscuta campestris]